jgi:glyoxylase-like metal-dependent hydrolase (beta-lactamase superfamily II)
VILERVEHPRWLSNTWLLADREGGEGFLIDAGGPREEALAIVRRHGIRVRRILLTHHHFDHAGEAAALARATGAEVAAHRLEIPLLGGTAARPLEDGDVLRCGDDLEVRVLHIPGHTAGQAAFLVGTAGGAGDPGDRAARTVVFTGDTLFRGSVGSTTAPGHTTFADLRRSIAGRLMALADDVDVAPGHAAPTTIGAERAGNPFVRTMLGLEPEGAETAEYDGRPVRLVVWGGDYDGGHKAWVRFADGAEATVPGSRVRRAGRPGRKPGDPA